ncbi:MAG: Na+/H+ antiporter NhaC family protein, partial [Woeseiaceae bacterium]
HVWPILMIIQIRPLNDANALVTVPGTTDFLLTTFSPVLIWCVMLFAIVTGYGRKFEGPAGEVLVEPPADK